ncbi:MAG: lactate dehydrogenase [Proteobacteria bacterium]|nr:lactate dehydrogenase [Pseudomonadota bacterium]
MKVLFAAKENAWGGFLHKIKEELPEHQFEATGGFMIESLEGVDVLIPTMTLITEEVLASADRLKLIQQCGSGLESVDMEAAKTREIAVANVPTDKSGNADSTAELGIYLMIGLSRHFKEMEQSKKKQSMGEPQGLALSGKTVGIIGLGGIGKALISRLKPFGVNIVGIKRSNLEEARRKLGLEWVGGEDELHLLLNRSDYIVLCLPYTQKNHHLINLESIRHFKPNSYLINLSRGGLIEREALLEALSTNAIAGAGLDVFWEEPPDPDDPIFNYNLMATPHIAGSTDVSIRGIVKGVADNIRRLASQQTILYRKC